MFAPPKYLVRPKECKVNGQRCEAFASRGLRCFSSSAQALRYRKSVEAPEGSRPSATNSFRALANGILSGLDALRNQADRLKTDVLQ